MKLASLFTDSMVLQSGAPIRIWGTDRPGQRVEARLGGQQAKTEADRDGKFYLELPPMKAGGPFELSVVGSQQRSFADVLVGEVWLCSGQSNMEWSVGQSDRAAEELAAAELPELRLFQVPKEASLTPQIHTNARWRASNRDWARGFSAVCFFFGRKLVEELEVPVGLIHASWGGTPAESWVSRDTLQRHEALRHFAERPLPTSDPELDRRNYERALKEWKAEVEFPDRGNRGEEEGWPLAEGGSEWKPIQVPGYWQNHGLHVNGAIWFRKEVEIPEEWAGEELTLSLGPIDDFDVTYLNGKRIGETGKDVEKHWIVPRNYSVPPVLVKPGKNTIAVRVHDFTGFGGFGGPAELMKMGTEASSVPLAGAWTYRIEWSEPYPKQKLEQRPADPQGRLSQVPGMLRDGMIAPLLPYSIRGVTWYQGESNVWRAEEYKKLLPALFEDWRKAFRHQQLPFYVVQLANFRAGGDAPGTSPWADLREAQGLVASADPYSALATTIDIGNPDDIHPTNKQEVGRRLALAALQKEYGRALVASGPVYSRSERRGPDVVLHFDHASGLQTSDQTPLRGFQVQLGEGSVVPVDASIEGDVVILRSVPQYAQKVFYGWASDPDVNLANGAQLPAVPFRADLLP